MTIGFNREEFPLSLTELARKAGTSRDTALDTLRFWEQTGLIKRTPNVDRSGAVVFKLAPIENILNGLNRLAEKSRQSAFSAEKGRESRPRLEGWFDASKESSQRQVKTLSVGNYREPAKESPAAPVESPLVRQSRLPDGASLPDPDPWELIKAQLREIMNPHSYSIWIVPTRLLYVFEETLYVRVPNPEWQFMQDQFGRDIEEAIKRLNLPYSDFNILTMKVD